jgi:hypothetical protein
MRAICHRELDRADDPMCTNASSSGNGENIED